jgi:hypothetical protein
MKHNVLLDSIMRLKKKYFLKLKIDFFNSAQGDICPQVGGPSCHDDPSSLFLVNGFLTGGQQQNVPHDYCENNVSKGLQTGCLS